MMINSQIHLQLYVRFSIEGMTPGLWPQLAKALGPCAPYLLSPPEPYWKMPDCLGFHIGFHTDPELVWILVRALAPQGWQIFGDDYDLSAVWNPGHGEALVHADVRWAELQLTRRESDAHSGLP